MAENPSTFSEVWYRVSNQSVTLRSQVKVQRQHFRGEQWHVLQDPYNNQFFRLRPEAYNFLARLNPHQTLEETWLECLEIAPDSTPGQEEIIQLLTQLYHANLIHYELPADSQKFFERYKKRKQKETRTTLLSIMFAKFPFLDPDDFLNQLKPYIRFFFSPLTFTIWLATLFGAIKLCIDNWDQLWNQGQSVLSSSNLPLLYCCVVVIKICHEFGHAFICKKYGGEVHKMGIMLMLFTPIPFIDASSSWAFPSKWQRILVGAGGMIIELFIASIAVFVWTNTGAGLIHTLAYNVIFIASVTTLLFNGNPLLRYDGYYIISDLLEIPNLTSKSIRQLRYYAERYLFGLKKIKPIAHNFKEATWLTLYGITSFIYRIIVFTGIILFVANQFLILGVIMAIICMVSWGIVPVCRFLNYLFTSPALERNRIRAISNTMVIFGIIILLLGIIPFPNYFHAPGIMKAHEFSQISNEYPGFLVEPRAKSGTHVVAGQPLFRLTNKDLDFDFKQAIAKLSEIEAVYLNALKGESENLVPIERQIKVLKEQIAYYQTCKRRLTVRAPHDGIWVAPELETYTGMWSARGNPIGHIINNRSFYFSSIVSQNDAARLFSEKIPPARVRLIGQSQHLIAVLDQKVIPAEQNQLPSAALGFGGGGDISVSSEDATQTNEPFFEVRSNLAETATIEKLYGRTGRIRFSLQPEPLLRQWSRSFWQLLQDRYQI